jgi:hypothetical protein
VAVVVWALGAGTAAADVPHQISFQGLLKDGSGNPVANGPYSVVFTLYDAPVAGGVWWAETTSVSTNGGLFSVALGSIHPIPDIALADSSRWLGIKVGADPEMAPRQKLASVGYGYRVGTVDGATGGRINGSLSFGNSATPMTYIYESGSLNPTRPVIAHSPAFPNYGLSYDDNLEQMNFRGNGTVLSIGLDSRFVGVNRSSQISSAEYFGVHAPVGTGEYGGMYVSTNTGGWPFYGYTNGTYLSYQYLDDAGVWHFNHGGADRIIVTQGGSVGINYASPLGMLHTASGGGHAILSAAGAAGVFAGDVNVVGTLSKSGGSFKIDHPTDPANKYLYHSFVESPDMKNIYDGVVTTDAAGDATVTLPEWFGALNRDYRYQLTVIGQFAQAIISKEISNNQFSLKTDKPGVKVSWQVTGIRQDAYANAHRIPVEEAKPAAERGYYLHPELFGHPGEENVELVHEANLQRAERDMQAKTAQAPVSAQGSH